MEKVFLAVLMMTVVFCMSFAIEMDILRNEETQNVTETEEEKTPEDTTTEITEEKQTPEDTTAELTEEEKMTGEEMLYQLRHPKRLNGGTLVSISQHAGKKLLKREALFRYAVYYVDLTTDQQIQMIMTRKYAIQMALLRRPEKLAGDALVALCQNPASGMMKEGNGHWYRDAMNYVDLTEDQQIKLAETSQYNVQRAMLLNLGIMEKLSYQAVLRIKENPAKGIKGWGVLKRELYKTANRSN